MSQLQKPLLNSVAVADAEGGIAAPELPPELPQDQS